MQLKEKPVKQTLREGTASHTRKELGYHLRLRLGSGRYSRGKVAADPDLPLPRLWTPLGWAQDSFPRIYKVTQFCLRCFRTQCGFRFGTWMKRSTRHFGR